MTAEQATAAGVVNPYDCHVEVPAGAEPDVSDHAAVSATLA